MTIDVPTNLPAPSLPGRSTPLDRGGGAGRTRRVLGDVPMGQPAAAGTMTSQALASTPFGSV